MSKKNLIMIEFPSNNQKMKKYHYDHIYLIKVDKKIKKIVHMIVIFMIILNFLKYYSVVQIFMKIKKD